MSNTFLGNEKYFRTEILQFQISLNTFYAAFTYLWLTVYFIEKIRQQDIFAVSAHI